MKWGWETKVTSTKSDNSKDYISLLPSWSEDINACSLLAHLWKTIILPHGFLVQLQRPGAGDP